MCLPLWENEHKTEQIERTRGWCKTHYNRWKRYRDPLTLMRERDTNPPKTCHCGRPHHAKGMCIDHYRQAYHLARQERRNARARANYRVNPAAQIIRTTRRTRGLNAGMDDRDRELSDAYRQAIASDPCVYCGASGEQNDHFFPVAHGGTDHWWNLVRACARCNKRKAAHCGTWFTLQHPDCAAVAVA